MALQPPVGASRDLLGKWLPFPVGPFPALRARHSPAAALSGCVRVPQTEGEDMAMETEAGGHWWV